MSQLTYQMHTTGAALNLAKTDIMALFGRSFTPTKVLVITWKYAEPFSSLQTAVSCYKRTRHTSAYLICEDIFFCLSCQFLAFDLLEKKTIGVKTPNCLYGTLVFHGCLSFFSPTRTSYNLIAYFFTAKCYFPNGSCNRRPTNIPFYALWRNKHQRI